MSPSAIVTMLAPANVSRLKGPPCLPGRGRSDPGTRCKHDVEPPEREERFFDRAHQPMSF
jgi:hypothetical protein